MPYTSFKQRKALGKRYGRDPALMLEMERLNRQYQIMPQMEQLRFDPDLMKKVNLYQCTLEEMQIAREDLQKLMTEKAEIEKIRPADMWQADIDEFVAAYCKEYKCKPTQKNNVTLNIAM